MGTGQVLLQKITEMFILMGLGYFLLRKKMLSDQGSTDIGKLLTTVVLPIILVNSLWAAKTPEKSKVLLESTAAAVIIVAGSVIISALIFRKDGVSCFSAAFSNAGFIGIPLVSSVLGSDAVYLISAMIITIGLLQYTIGLVMITGDKTLINPYAVLKNPVVLSVIFGVILYILDIPKPKMVASLFGTVGNINTPLAMILLGSYLAKSDLKKIFTIPANYAVSFVRLLLIPCAGIAVLHFLPFDNEHLKFALMITCACPAGSLGAIFAQQHGKDYEKATGQVCNSTVLCLLTLPIITSLATKLL